MIRKCLIASFPIQIGMYYFAVHSLDGITATITTRVMKIDKSNMPFLPLVRSATNQIHN
ncbi:hypothetical protein [Lysinibacillus fusiformis]